MTDAAHAFLAPSAAHRWVHCAASPRMEARYPEDQESPEAREGTAAHWYMTETLAGRTVEPGALAPNGHPVDKEMVDCAYDILRDVRDTLARIDNLFGAAIEYRVSAAATVHPENWGTPDIFLLLPTSRTLFIWDYKYGRRYVDAFRNWQCLDYAAAILETAGIPVSEWGAWSIVITIAQPRNYHPDGPLRTWTLTGPELTNCTATLAAAATRATEPVPQLTTGEHCRDCDARHACPALERVAMSLVDMSLTGQPIDLPPHAAGLELTVIRAAMKRLGARATGLEEELLAHARAGRPTPFWRAEYSLGREKWRDDVPTGQIAALGRMYGVDLLKPPAPITPNQAKKAGVDKEVVAAFAHTPRGAMALVPFTDDDIAKRFS